MSAIQCLADALSLDFVWMRVPRYTYNVELYSVFEYLFQNQIDHSTPKQS
jgi:hypothetical protein